MMEDRTFYLSCIKDIACYRGGIYWDYYQVLARIDEIERYWWISAIGYLNIMKAWRE